MAIAYRLPNEGYCNFQLFNRFNKYPIYYPFYKNKPCHERLISLKCALFLTLLIANKLINADILSFWSRIMAKVCQVTGKRPMSGNNVSHAKNRTRRRFLPNLQTHRFWVETENRFIRLRLTTKGMRIIDKKGIDSVLTDMRSRGEKI